MEKSMKILIFIVGNFKSRQLSFQRYCCIKRKITKVCSWWSMWSTGAHTFVFIYKIMRIFDMHSELCLSCFSGFFLKKKAL